MLIMLGRVYPQLGSVYERSVVFQESWLGGLAFDYMESEFAYKMNLMTSDNWQKYRFKLQCCYPFGFKCGNFFIIKTYTICLLASRLYLHI